jgi:hypothetical protein
MRWRVGVWLMTSVIAVTLSAAIAHAREAAFMDPGATGGSEDAVKVDPKGDIDTGESSVGVARRTTLFFVNQTNLPVKVEKIAVNNDGNVAAELTNDDCSKQGSIPPLSRCSVEVSVTPSSAGPWSIDVLLTHDGAGRIARAKLTGKTAGAGGGDKKDTGLALSTKEVNPVNFGEVEVGTGKAVRSALMINDSPDPITLYSIDVIEAGNGLQRLDQGCAVDMELKSGESCPVTLVWMPTANGNISTDLIIRHSGRLGFAVIPIRGSAKGAPTETGKEDTRSSSDSDDNEPSSKSKIPSPPSAQELENATAGKIAPVSAEALGVSSTTKSSSTGALRLIGTVGSRVVLLLPDGTTTTAGLHADISVGNKMLTVLTINAKSADVLFDGKKKTLALESAPELTAKAASLHKEFGISGANSSLSTMPAMVSSTPMAPLPGQNPVSAAVNALLAPNQGSPSVGGTASSPQPMLMPGVQSPMGGGTK